MLNVVTVHWRSDRWIDVQLRYLERNLDAPFRVFASLNGIDRSLWGRFHFAADLAGSHAEKLNELGTIVSERSAPGDELLFLDGDAFPVRPVGGWFEDMLSIHPLAAIRRDENLGDRQPHPCFCLTTVGFWNEIKGDWRAGEMWENEAGQTTDAGGKVLRALEDSGSSWHPILRSNTRNLHPVWFGVYEHRVYHHGAGFRSRVSRVDILREPGIYEAVDPLGPSPWTTGSGARTLSAGTAQAPNDSGIRRLFASREERRRSRRLRKDERLAERVFSWIAKGDGDFYLRLDRSARD